MGYFCLPPKRVEECSAEDLVDTAIKNLEMWKDSKSCTYLIECFAIGCLQDALKKINSKPN